MSNRSKMFRKNDSKFTIKNNSLKSNSTYIKNNKNELNDKEYYLKISSLFCGILGLSVSEMENFIIHNKIPNLEYYELIPKNNFKEMQESLNKAFKAGENKEHERHLKEEDEAFIRGKKYGAEQRENELRQQYNFVEKDLSKPPFNNQKQEKETWIQKERRKYSDPPDWIEKEREKYADEPDWLKKERERYSDPADWYEKAQEKYLLNTDLNKRNKSILDDFINFICDDDLLFTSPESSNIANLMISRMHDLLKERQK